MPGFGAVVEAECPFAGFAAEGEEVEDVAVGVLAVGADGVEVFVHGCEGLGVGWGGGGGGGGGHAGLFVWYFEVLDGCHLCRQRGLVSSRPWGRRWWVG